MLSPPELESGSKRESIGGRFYAVGGCNPRPLGLALHAALALAALETVDSDSDHAHSSWPTHEPKSHWSLASARPCSAHPRAQTSESNCRPHRGGAGLSLGPQAPPVALKLESKAPAEVAERPLQDSGSLGGSVRSPARMLRPPGRTCSAAQGRQAAALTSGARGHCWRVNPLSAGGRVLPAAAPPLGVNGPTCGTARTHCSAARSLHLSPPHPPSLSPSTRRGHTSRPPRCSSPHHASLVQIPRRPQSLGRRADTCRRASARPGR